MPLNVLDPSTWTPAVLKSPGMPYPVRYWQLCDPEGYDEEFVDGGNQITTLLAVDWEDAADFRWYAMGFAERAGGAYYFRRFVPLLCPYSRALYLVRLKKYRLHAGLDTLGAAIPARPDPFDENWFTLAPAPGAPARFPGRIVYLATFANLPFDVVDQDHFRAVQSFPENEVCRYVGRSETLSAKVRKVPQWTFERADTGQPIDEVGFVPFHDWHFTITWHRVPYGSYPRTYIEASINRANDRPFDYQLNNETGTPFKPDGSMMPYGRYREGDVLFEGLADKLEPYRGPNSEWLVDLHYLFRFQPADSAGDGMLKVPVGGNNQWVLIRQRGSAASPKYMYAKINFDVLFRPEP